MIGLGSNRLTVCRRGGMSVTQAGRGGMEWLAGGRIPSWASPYSAQATAYLQQYYAAYWSEIADYGRRNPTMVPYINEDPDLVCSLMNVGKTRWLKSDGSAYINTGYVPNSNTCIKAKASGSTVNAQVLSMRDATSNGSSRAAIACFLSSSQAGVANPSSSGMVYNMTSCTTTDIITYEINVKEGYKKIQKNGTLVLDMTFTPYFKTTTYPMGLFCINTAGSFAEKGDMKIAFAIIDEDGVKVREMYPFIRKINGVDTCGMIDVLSGTFYQNAGSGSFTISESPS